MKFVENSIELIEQKPGIEGMYSIMELAARECYQTMDAIKEGSSYRIIDNVCIKNGHTSVTEFGTVYLTVSYLHPLTIWKYLKDRYSRVKFIGFYAYITTTYRTIIQGDYKDPIDAINNHFDKDWKDDLKYWSEPTKHYKRYCFRMVMDRVGSQSVERHRGVWGISYAQESTRYVNYTSGKWSDGILVAVPAKYYDLIDKYAENDEYKWLKNEDTTIEDGDKFLREHDNGWKSYINSLETSEKEYMNLIKNEGWKPEDARGVLNLDIKTEFLMCAYPEDWKMWLFRRIDKHAHHQIQRIANMVNRVLKMF